MDVTGATPEWTYSEYARLPDDGNRYEVIDGEVCVTPAPGPAHQRVAAALFVILQEYVSRHGLGEMLWDVDLIERHRLASDAAPELCTTVLTWQPDPPVPALELAVTGIFRR